MKLTWLGHSCFLLESGGFRALLDPYKSVQGLADIAMEADAVYCSHGHFDHAYTDQVTLTDGKENPFTVAEISTFHDDKGGALRGRNIVRRFTAGDMSVVHLGDLGHQLSEEQLVAVRPCGVLLLPVGGTYTVDCQGAKQLADAIKPRVIVPMHYRNGNLGFDVLSTLDDFLEQYPAELVRRYPSNTLAVEKDMPEQIAVLRYGA